MRNGLLALGILVVLSGILWIAQGSGYFPYPESSFMIDQTPWVWRGAGFALFGVVLIILSRRRRSS